MTNQNKGSKLPLAILTIFLLILAYFIIRPFFHAIFLALITAYLSLPLYNKIYKKLKKQKLSSILTIIILVLGILLIAFGVSNLLFSQISLFATDIRGFDINKIISDFDVSAVQAFLDSIPLVKISIDEQEILNNLKQILSSLFSFVVSILPNISSLPATFVINLIIYFVTLSALIPNFDNVIKYILQASPLDDKLDKQLVYKFFVIAKAMIKGVFLIALIVGIMGAIVLALLGVKYSIFWGFLIMVLTILPMGGGIITLPIALYFLSTGHYVKGVILVLYQIIIAGNIDTVLRPKLVPKDAHISETIILVSFLGGLALWGFMGIFYGPIVVALLLTVLEYLKSIKR